MSCYEQILDFIESLQIIDTHEHLPNEADCDPRADVLSEWLQHYFSSDLVSAGLSDAQLAEVRDPGKDLLARWDIVEPFWTFARSTGYGRALDIAAHGLYGIAGVNRQTIAPLNEAFRAARAKGNHYQYVLKDKCRIALSMVDENLACDRRFFASVVRLDDFIMPLRFRETRAVADRLGVKVHRLEDWEEAMRLYLEQALGKGAVALKCGLAYMRPLHFSKPDRAAADRDFHALFAAHAPDWSDLPVQVGTDLQDHMMHALLRLADQRGLVFQFHTGLHEGNGNYIANSNPTLLTNLFLEYGNVKFDLFHLGYPYLMESGNLAKNFRNVFLDMCWGHIISPEAARRALVEWLDAVPANKISGFGGDYLFVDGVYGHQYLARRDVAASLAQKVADGSFDLDRARQIARWLLVDNPCRLFALAQRLAPSSRKQD